MRENGTDRDVALSIKNELSALNDALSTAATNIAYPKPIILRQPVDTIVPSGSVAYFSVVAGNVSAYQWQVKEGEDGEWANSSSTGNKKATVQMSVSAPFYSRFFRCAITGTDESVIYTDTVHIIEP